MAGLKVGDAGGVVRHVQRAFVLGLAVDAQALDHGEHFSRGFAEHFVQAAALLLAEGGLDVVRADPGAGVDQAHVAPGAAVADLPGLQQDHRLALFEQVDGRRQAGNAATDHANIGLVLTGQGLGGDGRFADEFPQAFLTQFGHGPAPAVLFLLQVHLTVRGRFAAHSRDKPAPTGTTQASRAVEILWERACPRTGGQAPGHAASNHQSNTIPCASGSSRE